MVIYKTTNLINGKFYIGQDSYNNPSYIGSGFILLKAIEKYGKHNFEKNVLEYCKDKRELNDREMYWIEKLDATNPNIAYNIATGGQGGDLGPIVAIKKSESLKKYKKEHPDFLVGSNNPNYNKETYHFYNILTNEDLICTKYELAKMVMSKSSDINVIITKKRRQHKNWILFEFKDIYTIDFLKNKNIDYSYRKEDLYRSKIKDGRKGQVRWVKEDDPSVIKYSKVKPEGFIRYQRKTRIRNANTEV